MARGGGAQSSGAARSGAARLVNACVEVLVWWGLMFGLWVLTLSGTTLPDDVAAAAAALMAAVAATAARSVMGVEGGAQLRWLGWLPLVAVSAVADTARVLILAARHLANRDVQGEIQPVFLHRPARSPGFLHRALATLAVTSTPGSIVLDEDPDEHSVLEHSLVEGAPDLERAVAR